MTKKEIINLIDALFRDYEYQRKFGKALGEFIDGAVVFNDTPLQFAIYEMLDEKLPNFYDIFSDFYEYGYDWEADTKELLDIGYYKKTQTDGVYKINKKKLEEAKKLPSYRELGTAEEVFDHYFPDF